MDRSTTAEERGQWLLDRMRETPMRRGALPERARPLKRDIARAIAAEGVPAALAQRVAFQLTFKFRRRDLYDEPEWRAAGAVLRDEIAWLREHIAMSTPRIVAALPKLSAAQIADFLEELSGTDGRIARTILHAALNTSEPLAIGRRYLAEYRLVARKVGVVDPAAARTLAATSFSAGAPLSKAMEHLKVRTGRMR